MGLAQATGRQVDERARDRMCFGERVRVRALVCTTRIALRLSKRRSQSMLGCAIGLRRQRQNILGQDDSV